MNRSQRVFKPIQKSLPGTILCKDMLVIVPTEHIVRGFLIENTTEKGRIYLWRVVMPLHRPMRWVLLNYSHRIPEAGEDIYLDRPSNEEAVARIQGYITEQLEYLRGVRSPRDFLRHIGRMIENTTITVRFDLALTYYRLGEVERCKVLLAAATAEVDRLERRLRVDDEVKLAARTLDDDPAALGPLIDEWESSNVERLGLLPSRQASATASLTEVGGD